jgi:hypothetical protein
VLARAPRRQTSTASPMAACTLRSFPCLPSFYPVRSFPCLLSFYPGQLAMAAVLVPIFISSLRSCILAAATVPPRCVLSQHACTTPLLRPLPSICPKLDITPVRPLISRRMYSHTAHFSPIHLTQARPPSLPPDIGMKETVQRSMSRGAAAAGTTGTETAAPVTLIELLALLSSERARAR